MPKFYVQSGTTRTVVQAESPTKAAVWAVHRVMQQILPIEQRDPHASSDSGESVTVLDGTVRVSEQGFDRDDASNLTTMEVVAQWNQMVTTLDRLERLLHGAI